MGIAQVITDECYRTFWKKGPSPRYSGFDGLELDTRAGTWVPVLLLSALDRPGKQRGKPTKSDLCYHHYRGTLLIRRICKTFVLIFILSSRLVGIAAGNGGSVPASPLASLHEMEHQDNRTLLLTTTDAGWG